jgi:hypothetical protein
LSASLKAFETSSLSSKPVVCWGLDVQMRQVYPSRHKRTVEGRVAKMSLRLKELEPYVSTHSPTGSIRSARQNDDCHRLSCSCGGVGCSRDENYLGTTSKCSRGQYGFHRMFIYLVLRDRQVVCLRLEL